MKKILVVEDNPDNRELVFQTLEDHYQLLAAEDGQTALDLVAVSRPDLILMDIALPGGLDGLEVCRRLKADPELRAIPIIVLTAHALPGVDADALDAGCAEYLTKPVSPAYLLQCVHAYCVEQ